MVTTAPQTRDELLALPSGQLIDRYANGVNTLDARLLELDAGHLGTYLRPESGAGRWSCRALIVHLADSEMVLVHRMRRIVCEDRPLLALWDEDSFIDAAVCDGGGAGTKEPPPLAGAIGTIHTLRMWTADWLRTLSEEALDREGLHPESGAVSVREILAYSAWHLEHHGAIMRSKIDLFLAQGEA